MLRSPEFVAAHRVSDRDFTRKRCLSLDVLVMFLLQMIGGRSLQVGLDQFMGGLTGADSLMRRVTKSALSQARKKLKPSALCELSRFWVKEWLAHTNEVRWNGWRVVAADGLCLQVPSWRETQDLYGLGPNKDGSVVVAKLVGLFAVASRQVLHVQIGAYLDGERGLLLRALQALAPTDLLVLDRGYPAWWLFALFAQRKVAFCARLDECGCGRSEIAALLCSGHTEQIIERRLNAKMRAQLASTGAPCPHDLTVRLRIIKVILPSGRLQILATSLLDHAAYPAEEFGRLYRSRWKIEEAFKTLKHRLHIEGFTGELPHAIEQDIHAKILVANITAALCQTAQEHLPETKTGRYRVNQTLAIKHWPALVVVWLRFGADRLAASLSDLVSLLVASINRYRPDRSCPRSFSIRTAQPPRRAYH